MSSPYRTPARAEIVVPLQPLTSTTIWLVWSAIVVSALTVFVVDSVNLVRMLWSALALTTVMGLVLVQRVRRRTRFDFVVTFETLRVERVSSGERELLGVLQLQSGVAVGLRAAPSEADFDLTVYLENESGTVVFQPGGRPADIAVELVWFLRGSGVTVDDRVERQRDARPLDERLRRRLRTKLDRQ